MSDVTGICYATVKRHLEAGILPAKYRSANQQRYKIQLLDMERYAFEMWYTKQYTMYNPFQTLHSREQFFLYFKLPVWMRE